MKLKLNCLSFLLVVCLFLLEAWVQAVPIQSSNKDAVRILAKTFSHVKNPTRFAQYLVRHYEYLKDKGYWNASVPELSEFPCPVYGPSPTKPTSASQLRPPDFDIVAAMGDSITAAFGAGSKTILSIFTEYVRSYDPLFDFIDIQS
jgi:hypothetical protein